MAAINDTGRRAFIATAAIAEAVRVKIVTGKLVAADADDENWIGVTERAAFNADEVITVAMRTKPGTLRGTAAGAFIAGALLYAAAAGKIDDSGTVIVGTAIGASSADTDIVEFVPHAAGVA